MYSCIQWTAQKARHMFSQLFRLSGIGLQYLRANLYSHVCERISHLIFNHTIVLRCPFTKHCSNFEVSEFGILMLVEWTAKWCVPVFCNLWFVSYAPCRHCNVPRYILYVWALLFAYALNMKIPSIPQFIDFDPATSAQKSKWFDIQLVNRNIVYTLNCVACFVVH